MIHLIYPEQEARGTNTRVQVRQHPQQIVQTPKMQRPHQSHLDSSNRERFTHSDSDLVHLCELQLIYFRLQRTFERQQYSQTDTHFLIFI